MHVVPQNINFTYKHLYLTDHNAGQGSDDTSDLRLLEIVKEGKQLKY